jgi:High potential iron-sulfur protein
MKESKIPRRQFLKLGGLALTMIPLVVASNQADAAVNASMRAALKYQDKPNDGKDCIKCMHFIPGPSATANGSCQVIPNDNEISPHGYCMAWVKKA